MSWTSIVRCLFSDTSTDTAQLRTRPSPRSLRPAQVENLREARNESSVRAV